MFLSAAYDIGIGQELNSYLYIRKFPEGHFLAEEYIDSTVSCHNYRRFWISWMDGTGGKEIKLGKNKVGYA